jgi:hypothetical protein
VQRIQHALRALYLQKAQLVPRENFAALIAECKVQILRLRDVLQKMRPELLPGFDDMERCLASCSSVAPEWRTELGA